MPNINELTLAKELIKFPSVTPRDAGAIGYLGWNGNMDTAIAIRTSVIKNDKLYIQCGAGIVNDSIAELEWEETMNKGKAIIQAYRNLRKKSS